MNTKHFLIAEIFETDDGIYSVLCEPEDNPQSITHFKSITEYKLDEDEYKHLVNKVDDFVEFKVDEETRTILEINK